MRRFFAAWLGVAMLGAAASAAHANNIFLTSESLPVVVGDTLYVDIWMDFTADPTIGGGIDIVFDPTFFVYLQYEAAPLGDPAFQFEPIPGDGELIGIGFGDFGGLTGPALVGTVQFDVVATPFDTVIFARENASPVGPFFSAVTFSQQDPVFGALTFATPIPLPGAAWLMGGALLMLFGRPGPATRTG